MSIDLKRLSALLLPPIVTLGYRALRSGRKTGTSPKERLRLSGDYSSWDAAVSASTGYDADVILRKTTESLLKVKSGEAAYERDSVLFAKIQYSWPLLAGLMWAAAHSGGRLNVLDFGGALGSSYFQNRSFIRQLPNIRWNIIEQPAHVRAGRELFENEHFKFYNSIEECLSETTPNIALLSGVLPYIERPYDVLNTVLTLPCICVIIDRTAYWPEEYDRLAVQHVGANIFDASYPMWVFSLPKFYDVLKRATIFDEFEGFENGLFGLMWKGFIIRRAK